MVHLDNKTKFENIDRNLIRMMIPFLIASDLPALGPIAFYIQGVVKIIETPDFVIIIFILFFRGLICNFTVLML